MRIGNQELNDDEAAWCRTFAGEISNFATKKAISSLNKKLTQADVQGLLQYLWSTPEVVETTEDVETKTAEVDETEDFSEKKDTSYTTEEDE